MNFIYFLILFRPILYFMDYFFDGLNILIAVLILFLAIFNMCKNKIINLKDWTCISIFFILMIKGVVVDYGVDIKTVLSNMISFISFIVITVIFINQNILNDFRDSMFKYRKWVIYQLDFIIIVLYIFLFLGVGYDKGWGMNVFIGYAYSPHSMCYALINLYFINECIYELNIHRNRKQYIFVNLSIILFTFLTGARVPGVFIIVSMVGLIFYRTKNKILISLLIIITAIIVVPQIDFLNIPFFQKFVYSIERGSISSGRDEIYSIALNSFINGNINEIVAGRGIGYIYKLNTIMLGSDIQAHNDFINILVMGGLFGALIIIRIYYLIVNYISRKGSIIGSLQSMLIIFLAFFNGILTYPSMILTIPFIIFKFYITNQKLEGDN